MLYTHTHIFPEVGITFGRKGGKLSKKECAGGDCVTPSLYLGTT